MAQLVEGGEGGTQQAAGSKSPTLSRAGPVWPTRLGRYNCKKSSVSQHRRLFEGLPKKTLHAMLGGTSGAATGGGAVGGGNFKVARKK